jgi:NIMA (never in mitosis gene a)-related kinase
MGEVHEGEAVGSWRTSYELVKKLGRGGFSTIHLVKETKSGTLFAAKRANLVAATSETRLRSMREVKVHSTLQPHPFLVKFHEAYIAKGSRESFIVMEYCSGGDLFSRLRDHAVRKVRIPEGTIAEWFTSIVLAISHMHKLSLVHGDLKSANVLFAEDGSIRICDFGMCDKPAAPHRQQALKRLHEVNGTPDYMSPELLPPSFGAPSFATDLWATGVLLYEMAALRLPFGGDGGGGRTLENIAERITKHPHDPLPGGCSAALESTVAALLSKKPAGRPTTVQLLESSFCAQALPSLQASPSCARFSLT